jgi:hypothetical protein
LQPPTAFIRDVYIPAHNARFAVKPEQEGSAFVAITGVDLAEILCVQETNFRMRLISYGCTQPAAPPSLPASISAAAQPAQQSPRPPQRSPSGAPEGSSPGGQYRGQGCPSLHVAGRTLTEILGIRPHQHQRGGFSAPGKPLASAARELKGRTETARGARARAARSASNLHGRGVGKRSWRRLCCVGKRCVHYACCPWTQLSHAHAPRGFRSIRRRSVLALGLFPGIWVRSANFRCAIAWVSRGRGPCRPW